MLKTFLYLNLCISMLFQLNPNNDSYIIFVAKEKTVFAVNIVFIVLGQTAMGA